jgi:hypothetical protein
MPATYTIVATVQTDEEDSPHLRARIIAGTFQMVDSLGLRLIACDWQADPEEIAAGVDPAGATEVAVLDLNPPLDDPPTRGLRTVLDTHADDGQPAGRR